MGNMLSGAFGKAANSKPKHKITKPQKAPQKTRTVRKTATKRRVAKTVRPTTAKSTDQGMIPWSLALDYRTIGILDALEKLYGLSNRDEALRLLFKTPLDQLVKAKGKQGQERFDLNRKVYDMNTRPKAIARHQKFGR